MDLKVFEHPAFGEIRIVNQETGDPWFIARDVAVALGYENPAEAVQDHCKKVNKITQHSKSLPPTNLLTIPESDVYRLIMRSNLPSAERFQDWVVEEVLPSIRKYGVYATDNFIEDAIADPDNAIRLLQQFKFERQQRQLAERQRDEAVRTKAMIGSRREATAMATASVASRKVVSLENRLGEGRDFKAAKAIPWVLDIFAPSKGLWSVLGKKLKAVSLEMGLPIHAVEHSKYGEVNAYHFRAIEALHRRLLADPNMLGKYRREDCAAEG